MDRKFVGGIIVAVGVVLLVISALADPIGFGDGDGFGWKQGAGVIIGAALAVIGLAVMYVQRGEAKTPQPLT
jgi:hypothetical protein